MSDAFPHQDIGASRVGAILRRRAGRLGTSVEDVLARDRVALRDAGYPGPDCLNPFEVARFFDTELPDDRVGHVESCAMCAALLDAGRPDERGLDRFMEEFRRFSASETVTEGLAGSRINPVRRPLVDLLWVEGPVLVAVLVAALVGTVLVSDTIMRNLLSSIALPSVTGTVAVGLALALLTVVAAKRLKFGRQPAFQRYGGSALGGVFAMALVLFGSHTLLDVNADYVSLDAAQSALLTALAEQPADKCAASNLLVNANAAIKLTALPNCGLKATAAQFSGEVVAERNPDGINVYWDTGKRRDMGMIYRGILQHGPEGAVNVLTDRAKIPIGAGFLEQTLRQVRDGTKVLALVPSRKVAASKVFPEDANLTVHLAQ